jgi:hypothetical protein
MDGPEIDAVASNAGRVLHRLVQLCTREHDDRTGGREQTYRRVVKFLLQLRLLARSVLICCEAVALLFVFRS